MTVVDRTSTLVRIEQALAQESREATIHDVKRAVIDEIEKVDRRVAIRSTDYFRHTYAPDLILRWCDDIDRSERWLYLRSKVSTADLQQDLATVGRERPIIFGLGSRPREAEVQPMRARSVEAGTLITDPMGFGELVPSLEDSQIPELVSRTILRGGRGLFGEQATAAVTRSIAKGFEAAFETSPDGTFAAARVIRDNLGEHSGDRLLRLLHAIWVGAGGRSDLFPDAPTLGGPLGDDALELLLNGPEIADPDFWRRLGDISLPQLARLRLGDRPANLGRLVLAHAGTLEARWCRVLPDQPRTAGDTLLRWGIEAQALALHGPTFSAYLAHDKPGLDGVEPVARDGISIEMLGDRAAAATAEISDVTATGGGLIVEVASESAGNVLDNPNASDTVGAAASNITRATATLANTRTIVCDFSTSTASSRTKRTLTLRELIRHGLPLVWSLEPDEMEAVAAMMSPVEAVVRSVHQPSLFDSFVDTEIPGTEQA